MNSKAIETAWAKVGHGLMAIARGLARDTIAFMVVLGTGSDFLINSHIRHHYSMSVMASWHPTLGLTPQYFRGQRLVDR